MAAVVLLPGEVLSPDLLPNGHVKSKTLTLGPGLQYQPPAKICAAIAGSLSVEQRKNAVWLETNGRGRYTPAVGDLVIATVHHSSMDFYHLSLTPYSPLVMLPQLAFEGATKKTRPVLQAGSAVYARVCLANKHMDPELECVHPSTGKSEGLGELKGGMLFELSLGMARRMMMAKAKEGGGIAILEDLAEKGLRFEIAVGRNGYLWVQSDSVKTTLIVGHAVQESDHDALSVEQQGKLARRVTREL